MYNEKVFVNQKELDITKSLSELNIESGSVILLKDGWYNIFGGNIDIKFLSGQSLSVFVEETDSVADLK